MKEFFDEIKLMLGLGSGQAARRFLDSLDNFTRELEARPQLRATLATHIRASQALRKVRDKVSLLHKLEELE